MLSSAACGYQRPYLQAQLERVRAAPAAAHCAHAIDPRTRLSTLFHAVVCTDRSVRRAPFLLYSMQANDLWHSEHLRLELRTMASRLGAAEGRACFRFKHFVCERCLPGVVKIGTIRTVGQV